MQALECVGKAGPGRGKKGGLSEYARALGKSQPFVSQLVRAAWVANFTSQLVDLLGHTQHISEIHFLPPEVWKAARSPPAWVQPNPSIGPQFPRNAMHGAVDSGARLRKSYPRQFFISGHYGLEPSQAWRPHSDALSTP